MPGKAISVSLEDRKVLGKGLNTLRAEGKVPAVIHDHGNPSIHVMGDHIGLVKAYAEAGKHHPVDKYILPAIGLATLATFGPAVYHLAKDEKFRKRLFRKT